MTVDVTGIEPAMTDWSRPFWDATRERRLIVQRCTSCDAWSPTPRPRCPACWQDTLEWTEPELEARLYSWALHAGRGDAPPRMVVLVDALPGLRMLSNLTDGDVAAGLQIDEPLELDWLPLDDGRALPQFRRTTIDPAREAS